LTNCTHKNIAFWFVALSYNYILIIVDNLESKISELEGICNFFGGIM
jgi:hypothetical protein